MDFLSHLFKDAQNMFKDMTRTQRVSVVTLIMAVGVLLLTVVYIGSSPTRTDNVPLTDVSPSTVKDVKEKLEAAGLGPVEYREGKVWVSLDKRDDAILLLAQENMLSEEAQPGFDEMLNRWDFTTTGPRSREMMRFARGNMVARLIEKIDIIKEARVIYSDSGQSSLFGPSTRQRAAVEVVTLMGKELNQPVADTIIALTTAAKGGLEAKDVVVTDQRGMHFRMQELNSPRARAMAAIGLEGQRRSEITDRIERLCLAAVPYCQAWSFVDVKINMDDVNIHKIDYEEGPIGRKRTRNITENKSRMPGAEVGTRPAIGRAANTSGGGAQETYGMKDKQADMSYQPDVTETTTAVAPKVEQVTLSAVIKIPYEYRLKKDENGKELDGEWECLKDHNGDDVLDEKNRPLRRKFAGKRLTQPELAALERNILRAAGALDGADDVQVEIMQVDWFDNQEFAEVSSPATAKVLDWVFENSVTLAMFALFIIAMMTILVHAKRAIPSEDLNLDEPEALSLHMMPPMSEADQANASFEAMRNKIADMVAENPVKSAGLVRRWLTRDSY